MSWTLPRTGNDRPLRMMERMLCGAIGPDVRDGVVGRSCVKWIRNQLGRGLQEGELAVEF